MRRHTIEPRPDWRKIVESQGLVFHTEEGAANGESVIYWDESAYYSLTLAEVEMLESATNELHSLCLTAAEHLIQQDRFSEFGIRPEVADLIRWAWESEPPTLYGRFDLLFDGSASPKMLEYNADTPTALLEAAVIQWKWLEERFPERDQFNSIWEGLVDAWDWYFERGGLRSNFVHFSHSDTVEDEMTVALLRDAAHEVGISTAQMLMEEIGFDDVAKAFVDAGGRKIETIFKLYPWEWMVNEEFSAELLTTYRNMQWIEPIWKMLWSNKALLAVLWELNPGHPNLLPAFLDGPRNMSNYVKKARLGREGANIVVVQNGHESQELGPYTESGYVYQEFYGVTAFDGRYPVIGSWICDSVAHGIGIRESDSFITTNLSQFVPHLIID